MKVRYSLGIMTERTDAARPEFMEPTTESQVDSRAVETTQADPLTESSSQNGEEIMRIRVDEEDRLAFRVGVNILTLVLIGLGVWLIWTNYFAGN